MCQNAFKCSKTIFDQVLKFIYGLKDLEKSLINYWNEKHFENGWNDISASFGRPGAVYWILVVDRLGWRNLSVLQRLVLQRLVQRLVSYNRPPVQTGRPNWIETMHNDQKRLVFFEAYKWRPLHWKIPMGDEPKLFLNTLNPSIIYLC